MNLFGSILRGVAPVGQRGWRGRDICGAPDNPAGAAPRACPEQGRPIPAKAKIQPDKPHHSRSRFGLLATFLFYLLSALSQPVFAAWYQVEVIIFEYIEPDANGESWYENPGLPGRGGSIELITATVDDAAEKTPAPEGSDSSDAVDLMPYLALPVEVYRLGKVNRVLKLSKEYRPLLHTAWQQPGFDGRAARSVHLDNTLFEDKEKSGERPGLTWPELEEGWTPLGPTPDSTRGGVRANGNEPGLAEPKWEPVGYVPPTMIYDGFIRLRSSRFLYLDVDFAYFSELTEDPDRPDMSLADTDNGKSLFNQQADYVRLTESRRVRLNEIHYFDHPLFGLIIQVSRLKTN